MAKLKLLIWIISADNYRDSALTAYTRREALEKAKARGIHATRAETVEEYKARNAPRVTY